MQTLYVLRTQCDKKHFGMTKNDKSYVFAFQRLDHAHLANTNISRVQNFDVVPRKIINESCISVDLKIYIEKPIKPELFQIQERDIVDLLTMPILNNVGVVIASSLTPTYDQELIFDSILISPFDLFRSF